MSTDKRKRCDEPDWSIQFDDLTSLKIIVESAVVVNPRIDFRVKKIGDFYFLMVDGNDQTFTCCLSARLKLNNVCVSSSLEVMDNFTFCIDTKQLLYSMDSPSFAHGCMIIEGYAHNATVHVILCDPENRNSEERSELKTFVNGGPQQPLEPLPFNMILELDLTKMKDIMRKGRKGHAENLDIKVYIRKEGVKERSLVILSARGDSNHKHTSSNEMTRDEDGSMVVRGHQGGNEGCRVRHDDNLCFKGSFPFEKIEAFVKNIPVKMIPAKVQNGMPLMMCYNLEAGENDESHVRFLVAPKNEEEDLDEDDF